MKLVVLAGLVLAGHAAIAFELWPVTDRELVPLRRLKCIHRLDESVKQAVDVVMFGDSVLAHSPKKDKDRRAISKILDKLLPDEHVAAVHHPAFHMQVYERLIEHALAGGRIPVKHFVVPINMRSFSTSWHLRPRYQFDALRRYLKYDGPLYRFAYRPLHIFKALEPPVSQVDFQSLAVYADDEYEGRVKDFLVDDAALSKFTFHYMEELRPDHPKMRAMTHIAQMTRDAGVDVVFFVYPLNLRYGETVEGPRLREHVQANIRTIQKVLSQYGQHALDLSDTIPPSFFSSSKTAGEHLSEKGRRFVARKLSEEILSRESRVAAIDQRRNVE